MRLRKVRLAGFKSFVDPTTISFPSDLVGIVGPNGCGKSNVIDAVRWVMGEISAKHLRGDTMADVVFTGSATRKPVSQASVELVFDNTDGRAGGRYASYAEIAVKRQVARDGQSSYFLNSARCRRRDVMDIFLGTGLGPRSYAIIEQGMISRLIEAKPEELREFLEEAAGISKYKERRRETENRIRHTNDNLSRINDLRDELGKRLQHLKRQATMAEKYQVLKQDERKLQGELLALRWRALSAEAEQHNQAAAAQENVLEAALAEQRRIEADLEQKRVAQASASEHFNTVYRHTLDAGAALARIEEAIENQRQQQTQLRESLSRERQALGSAQAHVEAEALKMQELGAALTEDEPALERLQGVAGEARLAFREAEEAVHAWQSEWEALSERAVEPDQIKTAESTRVEHVLENARQIQVRIERLQAERRGLDIDALARAAQEMVARLESADEEIGTLESAVTDCQSEVQAMRERHHGAASALHDARNLFQELNARLSSLQALQQAALGKRSSQVTEWLRGVGLENSPRLAEQIGVEQGWERALETVLDYRLEAVCVEGLERYMNDAAELGEGTVTLFDGARSQHGHEPTSADALVAKVSAPWSLATLLHGVYVAATFSAALSRRASLAAGESVVTPEGVWLGRNWLRVSRPGDEHAGVLAREQEIQLLSEQVAARERDVDARISELETARSRLAEVEAALDEAQHQAAAKHRGYAALKSELTSAETTYEQARARIASINTELADAEAQLSAEQAVLVQARERLARSTEEAQRIFGEREAWELKRALHRQRFEQARERWQEVRDEAYELGLRTEARRAQLASLEDGRGRSLEQLERHQARADELEADLSASDAPLADAQRELERKLAERGEVERELRDARSHMETVETALGELEQSRQEQEQKVTLERDRLNELRMQSQETLVRRQTVEEQAASSEADIEALLQPLDEDASEAAWQEQLEAMQRRITRLGPINLAAIDEHEQQSERKTYLDRQHNDLEEALATLDAAINKIDRETRARFKETYEKVNTSLSAMFPRLFGGGSAQLELTGDDLLNTGVSVMARPPGKRNTRIQLLSGGEKALTAVALVFAIFELNPAPFCLLDEVDAPLDDANVGRFCGLVKEMAEQVQLVLITHNKLTMEVAGQLIGVTMNEPGVSRLVTVDMEEAVAMVAV